MYGLGPNEKLSGELLIIDGVSYLSTVAADGNIKVTETYKTKAPFFVYTHVDEWMEIALPDSIENLLQLEQFIDSISRGINNPFCFKLNGTIISSSIHVVNLPPGTKVDSPEQAHQCQRNYSLKKESVEIIGFFSRKHQSVFTHHDTYLHMHLITADKKYIGHLDELKIKKESMRFFVPLYIK